MIASRVSLAIVAHFTLALLPVDFLQFSWQLLHLILISRVLPSFKVTNLTSKIHIHSPLLAARSLVVELVHINLLFNATTVNLARTLKPESFQDCRWN